VFRQVTEPFAVHSYRYRHHDPNLAGTEASFFASAQAVPQTDRLTLNVSPCGGKRCWIGSASHRFSKDRQRAIPAGSMNVLN
jgi:hypothetical protein